MKAVLKHKPYLNMLAIAIGLSLAGCGGGDDDGPVDGGVSQLDINQARAMFSSLRDGIAPYSNSQETGYLDQEHIKLKQELDQLTTSSDSALGAVANLAYWAMEMDEALVEGDCTVNIATTRCADGESGDIYEITRSGGTGTWVVVSGQAVGTTGTFSYTETSATLAGYVPSGVQGMTTKIGMGSASDNDSADDRAFTISLTEPSQDVMRLDLSGSIKDMQNGSPVFVMDFGPNSNVTVDTTGQDLRKDSANITGTFISSNYRLVGNIELSDLRGADTTESEDQALVGGNMRFTGTVNGTGLVGADTNPDNNFDLLVGALAGSATPSSGYNPDQPSSPTNHVSSSMTFTGTVKKSASDVGLELELTVTEQGYDGKGTIAASYTDLIQNIILTAVATQFDDDADNNSLTLTSSDGISVVLLEGQDAKVMKGTTQLGTISNSRVNFVDGTSQSLI
jgi:hypothetical protein